MHEMTALTLSHRNETEITLKLNGSFTILVTSCKSCLTNTNSGKDMCHAAHEGEG